MRRSQEREQDRSQPRSRVQNDVPGHVHERATSCQGSFTTLQRRGVWWGRIEAHSSPLVPFFLLCYPGFGLPQVGSRVVPG